MAVNLINSSDIEVTQTGNNIELSTTVDMHTLESNVGNISDLTTTDKSSVVNAINEIKTNIGGTLLWTNPNPTSYFSGQNISLSSSDYDILEVFYITHVSNERNIQSIRLIKGFDGNLTVIPKAGGEYTREFNRVSDTSYTFSTGYTYTSYMGGKTATANVCVPLYIVGYKTGLFS